MENASMEFDGTTFTATPTNPPTTTCDYCKKPTTLGTTDYCGKKQCEGCRVLRTTRAKTNFFRESGAFVPEWLIQEILEKHTIISPDGERLYEYREETGIYVESHAHLNQLIQEKLGELNSKQRAAETLFALQNQVYNPDRAKTPPLNYIPFSNIIYDLEKKETRPFTPELFFTTKLAAEFDSHLHDQYDDEKTSACPAIHKFLGEVMTEENREVFYQLAGYCLYRAYPVKAAVVMVGSGNNGKSTALNCLEKMLGVENCSNTELQDLAESRFASSQLIGKHANICADLSKTSLRETGKFKMLTGEDILQAEFKYRMPVGFRNYAKLVFSANAVPFSHDETDAFFSRWVIINFERQFTESDEIPKTQLWARLTTQAEINGLAMEGLKRLPALLAKGWFNLTRDVQRMKDDYVRASDPIGAFLLDCVVDAPGGVVAKDELYRAYIRYCHDQQLQTRDKAFFGKVILAKKGWRDSQREVDGRPNVHCWLDVSLSEAGEVPEEEQPQTTLQ